ncbi:helix-turn-helix domain-containing protein [Nonomuraea sp. SBT364]|uniref:helix-turn-helix domain-containing protein n=1 Tax=Nonomuraea sp. SBT364 TaxID=1580530 RepID=UPI0007C7560D|nr:helix-turn-helix domain-containing protein [Nonomuraea sp. SBT364]
MARDTRELNGAWARFQRHGFPAPAPDLAPYVESYWVVTWDYAEPYRQLIVPYPSVHLTFVDGAATLQGPATGHQVRVLEGRGSVFGVAFRPGAFRPFLGAPVSTITDRRLDAAEVFSGPPPDPAGVASVEAFLRAHLPAPDHRAARAAEIVALVAATPGITRVDALARATGLGVRDLQRLFAEHVGLGPKRVIRRYRLREATDRMAGGTPPDWAALAADLGYADQAHFTRDFRKLFGESPTWYARRF